MNPYRVLQWQTMMSAPELARMKGRDREDAAHYQRATASRALADKLLREEAITERRVEPDPEDPWGGMREITRWSVAVLDPADTAVIAGQLAEARAEGLRMAAEIVSAHAARYERVTGPCGHVIKHSLSEAAMALEAAAGAERQRWSEPSQQALSLWSRSEAKCEITNDFKTPNQGSER